MTLGFPCWADAYGIVHWVVFTTTRRTFTACSLCVVDRNDEHRQWDDFAKTQQPPTCMQCIVDAEVDNVYEHTP